MERMAAPPVVLIVDDEASVRRALVRMLAGTEAKIVSAASAEEAWPLVEAEPPALVICDYRLGRGENGAAFLARVHGHCPTARLVLHTADDVAPAEFEVWPKPADMPALRALVTSLPR